MEYDRRLVERRKREVLAAKRRERGRERNGDRDKEKKTKKRGRRRWERPRVYNSSPPPSPYGPLVVPLTPSSPGCTSSSLQGHSCPHFPWHWGFFRGLARREAARSRQAAKREQTDHSRAEPTPTRLEVDTRFSASLYLFVL